MKIVGMAALRAKSTASPSFRRLVIGIAAVMVSGDFGNPSIRLLGAPLTALSPLYGYKTIDLCNGADPVCSNGDDRPAHSLYVEAGLTTQAAQFVADRLTTQAPISTLAGQTHG